MAQYEVTLDTYDPETFKAFIGANSGDDNVVWGVLRHEPPQAPSAIPVVMYSFYAHRAFMNLTLIKRPEEVARMDRWLQEEGWVVLRAASIVRQPLAR